MPITRIYKHKFERSYHQVHHQRGLSIYKHKLESSDQLKATVILIKSQGSVCSLNTAFSLKSELILYSLNKRFFRCCWQNLVHFGLVTKYCLPHYNYWLTGHKTPNASEYWQYTSLEIFLWRISYPTSIFSSSFWTRSFNSQYACVV